MKNCIFKRICIILALIISVIPVVSCNTDTTTITEVSECTTSRKPDTTYYSSQVFSFTDDGYHFLDLLSRGESKYVITYRHDELAKSYSYVLSSHTESDGEWNTRVYLDSKGSFLGSFCFACNALVASTAQGFDIYDPETGAIISQKNDLFDINMDNERLPVVESRGDGFVLLMKDSIMLFSETGDMLSKVTFPESYDFAEDNSYFYRDGKDYLVVDDCPFMQYYSIDYDQGTVTLLCSSEDLGLEFEDAYRSGGFAIEDYSGNIYKLDPSNKSKSICQNTGNMMIRPMIYSSEFVPKWYIFGDSDFAIHYQYSSSEFEIVLLIPDDTLNLADRTTLILSGYEANSNCAINYAAYLYNMSQSDYYLSVDNFSLEEYGYDTAEEAQASITKLMQKFEDGKAPDIFYGNSFDYDRMGRDGMVLDLSPYIDKTRFITNMDLPLNIRNLYYADEHCYKVFPGFSMFGLWSSELFAGYNDNMSINDIRKADYCDNLFGDSYAVDIADFSIRYPIRRLISDGKLISEEEFSSIVSYAIENGMSPDSDLENKADIYSVASKETSLFLDYIGGVNVFAVNQDILQKKLLSSIQEKLNFVGFPTLGGAAHVAYPYGLVAVSSQTEHPEEVIRFISLLFSDEVQNTIARQNYIPARKDVFEEYLSDPSIPTDVVTAFRKSTDSIDTLMINDFGMYNIIAEEISSYYTEGRSVKDIAHSLRTRLQSYCEETGII